MAKIVITIEDENEYKINYKCECETPEEVNEKGEPTLAIQAGHFLIHQLLEKAGNSHIKFD